MDKYRLSDIIKGATRVNLNYSTTLLNLSRDYIKAMSEAIVGDASTDKTTNTGSAAPEETPQRAPLLVAGRQDEVANAAVAVNNTSSMSGTVSLQVQGDFGNTRVQVEPENLTLAVGEGAIVRVIAHMDKHLEENRDYPGTVIIPELGLKVTDFIIRRLPDAPKAAEPTKQASSGKTTTKKSAGSRKSGSS